MGPICPVLILVLSIMLSVQGDDAPHLDVDRAEQLFDEFIFNYNKEYKDDADKAAHFDQFKINIDVINKLNDEYYPNAVYGINMYADLESEEMKQHMNLN